MSSTRPTFRVFLSGVSTEFGLARSAVASDLRARGLVVKVQEDFRQEPDADTTLCLLHIYIRDCDAVVCLVGSRSGDRPPAPAVAPFRDMLPADVAEVSYTQWEFFFARHYNKRCSVYIAGGYTPEQPASSRDSPELAASFLAWLKGQGLNRAYFASRDELRVLVLREPWPETPTRRVVHLPYPSLGTLFKGRDAFLARLRASLRGATDGKATAIVGKALHGLGGVGKMRLAVEYAWQHQEDYSALLFVPAQTPEDLRRNLAALCGPLVLDLAEHTVTEEEVRLAAALHWLHEHPGWFLILDNVDTPAAAAAAEEMLARLHGGQVLLTGRLTTWSGCVEPLELDVLKEGDAAAFLLERTERGRRKRPTDAADATELARELDGLALAMEQAGAYIVQRRVSLADYLAAWRAHVPAVQQWHNAQLMKYPRSLAVTWQTTMEQLGAAEVALLRLLVWLAPAPVPQWLVEEDAAQAAWHEAVTLAAQAGTEMGTGSTPRDAIVALAGYSLLRWDVEAATVSVHRVVQEVLRSMLPPGPATKWLTLGLRLLHDAKSGDPIDVRSWERWDPLWPHVAVAAARGDVAAIAEPTARLMARLGELLYVKALYSEAERLWRRALAIDECALGADHHEVAVDRSNLAQLLKATNRLEEAEPLMLRALAIDERIYGPNHFIVALRLNNLAGLLYAANRFAEAEPLMWRALAVDEASLGADHPNVVRDINNLCQLLMATNRMGEAERLMRRALATDEHAIGVDHPNVARDLNNLAQLLMGTSRLTEAEPLIRRAIRTIERSLGEGHPMMATALSNLAQVLMNTNRQGEAEPLMRRALAIDECRFGLDHPNVAIHLNNLAQLLQATNRRAEVEPLLRRALAIDERGFGAEHPRITTYLNNLALLLHDTNRLREAELLYRRALAIDERSFGASDPKVARSLNNLAQLLQDTNRRAEAEPLLRRALAILVTWTRRNRHPHPQLQATGENLYAILHALGRSEEEIRAALLPREDPTL